MNTLLAILTSILLVGMTSLGCQYEYKKPLYFDLQGLKDSGLYVATYKAQNKYSWYGNEPQIDSIWLIRRFVPWGENSIRRFPEYAFVIPEPVEDPVLLNIYGSTGRIMSMVFCQLSDTSNRDMVISRNMTWYKYFGYYVEVRPFKTNNFPELVRPEDTVLLRFLESNPDTLGVYWYRYVAGSIHFVRKRDSTSMDDTLLEAQWQEEWRQDEITRSNEVEFFGKVIFKKYDKKSALLVVKEKGEKKTLGVGNMSKEFLSEVQVGDSVATNRGDSVITIYRGSNVIRLYKSYLRYDRE